MSWEIRVPYKSRDDKLSDVALASVAITDDEDRHVAEALTIDAALAGVRTAGDLLDRLEQMGQDERRELLDRLRERVGYESASDIEAAERGRQYRELARRRARELERLPEEHQPQVRASTSGGFVEHDPLEVERMEREEARARAALEERRRERDRLAAEQAGAERAREEKLRRELPPGFGP